MLYLLLLATVSVAFAADAVKEAQPEMKPAESAQPIRVLDDGRRYRFEDGLELIRSRDERQRLRIDEYRNKLREEDREGRRDPQIIDIKDEDRTGPLILRSPDPLPSNGKPDIERQNRIIADVYSPDYFQPTWILDYRYLKTGGRDYTRGPGGQVLILPRNVRTNEKKEFPDFDSFLEHLRLSRLSEREKSGGRRYGDDDDAKRGGRRYGDDDDAKRGYQSIDIEQYGRGQQQNLWKANRNY